MPTTLPRVQVTIDGELEAALDAAAPSVGAPSRSALIRDLAMRGAEQVAAERNEKAIGLQVLLDIVGGASGYDPSTALEVHAEREARR
jgi:metal-responsive CopG/Arc/MetJ family transcriptional regulator